MGAWDDRAILVRPALEEFGALWLVFGPLHQPKRTELRHRGSVRTAMPSRTARGRSVSRGPGTSEVARNEIDPTAD